MKKVLKPARPEEAIHYSDFSGRVLKDYVPVTVKIECGYGSEYDGASVEFHLSDKGLEQVLEFFKDRLCSETKEELKKRIKEEDQYSQDDCDSRDWTSCDYHYNCSNLYKKLI